MGKYYRTKYTLAEFVGSLFGCGTLLFALLSVLIGFGFWGLVTYAILRYLGWV